jgi:hypothetical protein
MNDPAPVPGSGVVLLCGRITDSTDTDQGMTR